MFSWFTKSSIPTLDLGTDIHSHLLPNLDDGVQSFEQAEEIILKFKSLGYRKLIVTPHVISDAYRNTTDGILSRLSDLRLHLAARGIEMELAAAAEYYLDEDLFKRISGPERLLTFGKNYLLFETNFLTEPFNMKEFIFLAKTNGYEPVLAHPERYIYLQQQPGKMQDLLDRGVLFQLNISSFTGYYSRQVQTAAKGMVERGWVHFLGSDCHHIQHANLISTALGVKFFQRALSLPLFNKTL